VAAIGEAFGTTPARQEPPRARGAKPKPPAAPVSPNKVETVLTDVLSKAREFLTALPAKNRPRKRQGLVKHLVSGLGRKHPETVVQRLVDQLIREGVLQEADGQMTYRL
jgi:hypothetical protein